jgi:hypothetical protein
VIAWCRDSDCQPQPTPAPTPTPLATPTPTPPVCDERVYDHVEPPRVVEWYHEPDYPTVVGQDPRFRGFDLVIEAQGGYAERRQVVLEQRCPDGTADPAACPQSWTWQCSARVLQRHDDPLVAVDLPMRLADSSVTWLEQSLRPRYPGASHKEGLPRVFQLWRGEAIGGQAKAQMTLAQGRAFLNTLATWGLWLILPLGYLSLLAQGLLAHPPVSGKPAETIAGVRTRGRSQE